MPHIRNTLTPINTRPPDDHPPNDASSTLRRRARTRNRARSDERGTKRPRRRSMTGEGVALNPSLASMRARPAIPFQPLQPSNNNQSLPHSIAAPIRHRHSNSSPPPNSPSTPHIPRSHSQHNSPPISWKFAAPDTSPVA